MGALAALEVDLVRVDRALQESIGTSDGFLAEIAERVIEVGSSRLRSTLTLTAAYATGGSSSDAVTGGAACELVHLGSLYHDDVIGDAEIRRGVPSANAHWSNCVAILAGDLLLARASSLAASLGAEVAAVLAEAISELCRGEVLELQHRFDVDRTEEGCESAMSGKTAALFAASCRIGGMVADASDDAIDALTRFGHHFGMCFQIVDDTFDLSAAPERLSKPDRDLRDGMYTLPVIYALRDSSALRAMLSVPLDGQQLREARRIVIACNASAVALDVARSHAGKAADSLRGAGALATDVCTALIHLVEDLVARVS